MRLWERAERGVERAAGEGKAGADPVPAQRQRSLRLRTGRSTEWLSEGWTKSRIQSFRQRVLWRAWAWGSVWTEERWSQFFQLEQVVGQLGA